MKAILKSATLAHTAVDEATGIISGCKLMQVGKTAVFKGSDGKPKSFEVTAELIKGLLTHAGNRSIPAHFTHDYEDTKDPMHARLGLHKNLRIDEDGDLASDLHTAPNEYGRLALWTAKTDPATAAFSAVFDYNPLKAGDRNLAIPLSFDAADFVSKGAATTAMLSQFQTDIDMTKDEIVALIKENAASKDDVTAAVRAALSEFKPTGFLTPEQADEKVKAALSAHKTTLSDEEIAKLALAAEAKFTAKLGSGPLLQSLTRSNDSGNTFQAKLGEYRKSSPNEATAIARLLKDHPELQEAREEHLRNERAKLSNA